MGRKKRRSALSRRGFLRGLSFSGVAAAGLASASSTLSSQVISKVSSSGSRSVSQAESPFQHGVASGDPLADRVIIWTRVTVADLLPTDVEWEVSSTPDFERVVANGLFNTSIDRDHTVKVDVTGLSAATSYYYRFKALNYTSQIGRTRTLPTGQTDHLRFAVASCASYEHGFFNAYRRISERADLDCVIHLGDYLYEYGNLQYGTGAGGRLYDPPHEMLTLDDYRRRHAHYKKDIDLQHCHQQHPFICVWDDHELANDAWHGGAENHQAGEGNWSARASTALKAYTEWMPIRLPEVNPEGRIYRSFTFGDLVELVMLDTRFFGRSQQVAGVVAGAGFTDTADFADTSRDMLDLDPEQPVQRAFLQSRLEDTGARWKLLGQQVMFSQLKLAGAANATNLLNPGGQGGVFLNPDQWDGYPRSRERLWDMIRGSKSLAGNAHDNVVVLTGDIHTAWSMDVTEDPNNPAEYDPQTGAGSMAVEFVATSVTSPGLDEVGRIGEEGLKTQNPHMKYINLSDHGYLLLDITHERCQGEHWFVGTDSVNGINQPTREERFAIAHFTADGDNRLQEATEPSSPKAIAPAAAPYEGIPV